MNQLAAAWRWWASAWDVRSRLPLALKAALAAGIAWQAALLLPSPVDRYAYYAPLGAVLAMYPTVVSSARAAGQTVLGILLGATVAFGVDTLMSANVGTVAVVVAAGVLVGGFTWLGEQRSWVPITALLVFTIGDPGSPAYAVGYVVLTVLGAAIGTGVNFLVFPPLHLREGSNSLAALQDIVVDQMLDLADGLEHNEAPDADGWQRRTREVSPQVTSMHQALSDVRRSRRANPRARRRFENEEERQERQAQAFQRLALLVEDMTELLLEVEGEGVPILPINTGVRLQCAEAMRALAELARAAACDQVGDEQVETACSAVRRVEETLENDPRAGGADPFAAGSIVTALRRCLGALITGGGAGLVAQNRHQLF